MVVWRARSLSLSLLIDSHTAQNIIQFYFYCFNDLNKTFRFINFRNWKRKMFSVFVYRRSEQRVGEIDSKSNKRAEFRRYYGLWIQNWKWNKIKLFNRSTGAWRFRMCSQASSKVQKKYKKKSICLRLGHKFELMETLLVYLEIVQFVSAEHAQADWMEKVEHLHRNTL